MPTKKYSLMLLLSLQEVNTYIFLNNNHLFNFYTYITYFQVDKQA